MANIRKSRKEELGAKRNGRPYNLFVKEQWKDRGSNVPFIQYAKELSIKWNNMDEGEKRIWYEKAARENMRHEQELARSSPPMMTRARKPVKKPRSAFIFFCMEKRPQVLREHPDNSITEISIILGKMWGKLTATEKGKYSKMAELDKKRYYAQMDRTPKAAGIARTSARANRRRSRRNRKELSESSSNQEQSSSS